jgi:hypothetical protein
VTSANLAINLFKVKSSRLINLLLTRGISDAADSRQASIRLARVIAAAAEFAYARQDLPAVKEASDLLIASPLPQAQCAGLWYLAFVKNREGHIDEAARILDALISDPGATPRFRARAFQALGVIHQAAGDLDLARQLYCESAQYTSRASPADAYLLADSIILHSYAHGAGGDNRRALKQLLGIERLIEVIHNPLLTATYCNNVASELVELGRVSEAAPYSRVSSASWVAYAYPEFRRTAQEVERRTASRNAVAVAAAVGPEARGRAGKPEYQLIVVQNSRRARVARPVVFRQRVRCSNQTVAQVALVASIRAPSKHYRPIDPQKPHRKKLGQSLPWEAPLCPASAARSEDRA